MSKSFFGHVVCFAARHIIAIGEYTASRAPLTDGNQAPLQIDALGNLRTVDAASVTAITNVTVTVNATAAAVSGEATAFSFGVLLAAPTTNSARIYLGGSTVSTAGATKGIGLDPGDSLPIPSLKNLALLSAIADADGQELTTLELS